MSARAGRGGWRRRRADPVALDAAVLVEVRAALLAGAGPSGALATGAAHALPELARALRLGTPLARLAAEHPTGEARADLLVRALAVAETAGAGAVDAVDQAARSAREERAVARLLRARTAQARATAVLLTVMPAVLALVLTVVGADPLAYYATPFGWVTGSLAVTLAAAGLWCARRLVGRARTAAAGADPLVAPPAPRQPWRLALWVPPAVVLGGGLAGAGGVVVGGTAAAAFALRRPPTDRRGDGGLDPSFVRHSLRPGGASVGSTRRGARRGGGPVEDGGAAEAVDLVAVGLRAGLPPTGALAAVAPLAPSRARAPLAAAARRLQAGRPVDEALAGTGLAELGRVLAASDRWGAPAEEALAGLADELRADRRAAAEIAAERAQLALVFPTTLLTLPAFALAVVPPLVWTAFADGFVAPM